MNKPEMIIFDYGRTILYEPDHSTENGNRAIYKYIDDNPDDVSFDEFHKTCVEIYSKIRSGGGNLEIHEYHFLKLLFDYLNVRLSVSIEEAERIIWNGISKGAVMPYAAEMLDFLNENGIRTAVISNLNWSKDALEDRINRLLPNNKFEFILASSEYVFPKPHSFMFEIALKKAGLPAESIWFCGDSVHTDLNGAYNIGMFPVLYDGSPDKECEKREKKERDIEFEYLHIHHWNELVEILRGII